MTTGDGVEEPGRFEDTFVVPDSLAGQRVDRAVAMVTGWSRAEVQAIADRGEIEVAASSPRAASSTRESGSRCSGGRRSWRLRGPSRCRSTWCTTTPT